jgi:hypothetical protein
MISYDLHKEDVLACLSMRKTKLKFTALKRYAF